MLNSGLSMSRVWAMPNSQTFTIKPVKELIEKNLTNGTWADPFVRNSIFKDQMSFTNDLNPDFDATHHMDALEFLKTFDSESLDGVLFDPPYSPRQIAECYQGVGRRTTMQDTQASFWGNLKKEIGRIIKPGGHVITCGWNSGGCGKSNGFELIEVLLVPHGGWHNDTIVTVERKNV
jgi:hypothetical protein